MTGSGKEADHTGSQVATAAEPPALPDVEAWLVDGYNALHAVILGGEPREGWWRESGRRRLIERVAALRDASAEVWVVFDGSHTRATSAQPSGPQSIGSTPTTRPAHPHVTFEPSADEWLVRRVKHSADPARIGVVTADRKLAARCRHAGSHVVSPRDFLAHCPSIEQAETRQTDLA